MTPEEFEQKIAWIESLLKRDGARVRWNHKIPDPDNPEQKRQIDVTIQRGNKLTLVECRYHSKSQDVKWVEELYGRRVSLNAYSVIAVSASGFTKGAIKKAEKLGVVLRDFRLLTDEEIASWGSATSVYLEYIFFSDIIIHLISELSKISVILSQYSLFQKADGEQWPLEVIFKQAAVKISDLGEAHGNVKIECFTKDLFVAGKKIEEIIFQSNLMKS